MKKSIAVLVVGLFAETLGATTFSAFAPGATFVTSAANATPTPIASLTALCPASGVLVVTGSGESAALSNFAGNAFIGLAYSIARNSTATDNGNVVQSSALAVFNGDANRDFLNVERVDSCTPGAFDTYTLMAYATTPQTSIANGSFVWNGRLTAVGGSAVSNLAAGSIPVASAANATPTVVTTLIVACPASGLVAVTGSGESAAVSNFAGNAFIGLAYSIARNSTATDNGNVVQSSALAVFNGDANRDFLNVQRVDTCTPGLNYSYSLTAYATTSQTGIVNQSFVWNGRLTATALPVASTTAPGTTFVASAGNATPTVVTSMNVVCPASGTTVVAASGESAAKSTFAGNAFIGLAYSIARDATATDNGNVVQSSALAKFNGDANRDFLNLQRVDSCTPGAMHNYALTAYATTPQTGVASSSFVWNGRLVAILNPDPIAPPGTLVNGFLHTGSIALAGEVDTWTFTANAGERIAVNIGQVAETDDFRPWIRLQAPGGTQLGSQFGIDAAQIDGAVAPTTGTYVVLVASADSGLNGIGTYRLTMTKTPGPATVAVGDQGGPLANGALHTGEILQGDLDVWTFTASAGERIAVNIGQVTETDDFFPWIRLWAPNNSQLGSQFGADAAQIDGAVAPVTGTYLVLVASADSGVNGSGTYRLTMTRTPGPITVSAGDQGGPLTNGALHTGEILQGDLDVWTFTASAGERIAVNIGQSTETDDFRPWIRLWAPNGSQLGSQFGIDAAQIDGAVAPVTGTYLVLVGSADSGVNGSGTYRLTMTKTPGPITVSAGDQGGPLTNGALHTGEILQGDLDVWTFTANTGERIAVNIGQIAETDDFRPWIRLWAPNGSELGSQFGTEAAQIDGAVAPATGTYLVLVGSADSGVNGSGTYRLTMAKTPGPITVSAGDQGGPLANGSSHAGEILQGDLDVWTFTATAGENISVSIGQVTETDDFRPWIRLWAPNGAVLGSQFGTEAAQINGAVAPVSGTYLVLVGSADSGVNGSGTYSLTLNVAP